MSNLPQYLDGGQNSLNRSYDVPVHIVDFDKQCSYDCRKCEQCNVVGLEGEKKHWNCNQECARCIQCKTFATPPLSYHTPIPRDYLTLTHQPEFHSYYPEDHTLSNLIGQTTLSTRQDGAREYRKTCNKRCKNCNNFYLDDHRKHVCFECERKMVNKANCPKSHNPYSDSFFYKFTDDY